MQTLTYGYKKPDNGDKGSEFFPSLEDNIQRVNDHTHNGTNSSLLTAQSSVAATGAITNSGWTDLGATLPTRYRKLVTMPGVTEYDKHDISLRLSTGEQVWLKTEKVTDNTYYVYAMEALTLTAVYT